MLSAVPNRSAVAVVMLLPPPPSSSASNAGVTVAEVDVVTVDCCVPKRPQHHPRNRTSSFRRTEWNPRYRSADRRPGNSYDYLSIVRCWSEADLIADDGDRRRRDGDTDVACYDSLFSRLDEPSVRIPPFIGRWRSAPTYAGRRAVAVQLVANNIFASQCCSVARLQRLLVPE